MLSLKNLSLCLILVCGGGFLVACEQSDAGFPPHQLLRDVDKILAPNYVRGEWRYRGARAGAQAVIIYIQIPERLDMDDQQHKNYLRQAVCPNVNDKNIWAILGNYQLYIRTFNYVERNYTEAHCINPNL